MKKMVAAAVMLAIACWYAVAASKPANHAQFIPVQIPGALSTVVKAIRNDGIVAGSYGTNKDHCFVLNGKQYLTLDVPKAWGDDTSCNGINSAGTLVGSYEAKTEIRAFIYQNGKFTDISPNDGLAVAYAINDSGMVVGNYSEDGDHSDGFLWDGTTYTRIDVPGATDTFATGINNQGVVVLQWDDYPSSVGTHSSLFDGATYTSIDIPSAASTFAYAINNVGDVAANWDDAKGHVHGAIRYAGEWHPFMAPGATATFVYGINDHDVMTGYWFVRSSHTGSGMKVIP